MESEKKTAPEAVPCSTAAAAAAGGSSTSTCSGAVEERNQGKEINNVLSDADAAVKPSNGEEEEEPPPVPDDDNDDLEDRLEDANNGDGADHRHIPPPLVTTTSSSGFVPGPLLSLKEQIDKDKDDDSLRRWKEKLLGSISGELNGETEAEVRFHSIGIMCSDFGEVTTPLPIVANENESRSSRLLFTLREGSQYQLKFTFTVLHNIVSGLTYSNTVWKSGIQVDQNKGMLGTFAPQREPYVHTLEEETTPSGILARGTYSAKLKFEDDDKRCHLELKYCFQIKKTL
ncbi:unnamed protein product [Linum trigynum]|uniref:Rho GDP-dissociation inhibitor 1-like n=1 Tax=Linum trigynum TaxID=586398 RepID=A0AAV2CM02_9ROSI